MRRSALSVVGCALSLFIGAVPAAADNGPHIKGAGYTPDSCAACHRAHTAKAPYLLKTAQDSLCYICHGSTATGSNLDVQDGTAYASNERFGGAVGALRGGGFEYALIDTSTVMPVYSSNGRLNEATIPALAPSEKEASTSAHSIDESAQTAWGNGSVSGAANYGTTINLTCGSCHDPHGNGNYRILRGKPNESDASAEVNIADAGTKAYTTSNYWQAWDTNDKEFRWKISAWCSTCHTRYLAGSGSYKTDSTDAVFKYRHRTEFSQEEYEHLEAESPTKTKPNCVQCHVAHGSNAKMGANSTSVTWPNGTNAGSDSRLLRLNSRGVCQTCHHK
jgi:predicted CXXCH cytochrome family protein